jgi:hypothetical protein
MWGVSLSFSIHAYNILWSYSPPLLLFLPHSQYPTHFFLSFWQIFLNGFHYNLFIYAYNVVQSYSPCLTLCFPPSHSHWFPFQKCPFYIHVFLLFKQDSSYERKYAVFVFLSLAYFT